MDCTYDNPFDPDQIAIDADFTGPGGEKLTVPGFWDMPPGHGAGGYVVRFAPTAAGNWSVVVKAKDANGEQASDPIMFSVAASKLDGFIQPAENHRYFQFDSGRSYFALGLNLAWGNATGIKSYDKWFSLLSKGGGNFARVWISHPNLLMESKESRLGRYDQATCAFYDQVLQSAQKNGIYCTLTINNYRDLILRDMWGPADWTLSPYNAANGGPAVHAADFFTNADCQRLYRQRLRYIVARYSAYTSVFSWEFWNEQTYTDIPISPAWTQGMAKYVSSIDPYHHPVSTSFGANDQLDVWRMPGIGLTQEHIYPGEDIPDGAPVFASAVYFDRQFDKPCMIAESGIAGEGPDGKYDPSGHATNFHNGLWSAMMAGSAGGAVNWWWDNYVEKLNLWGTFTGAARFSQQVDWAKSHFEPVALVAASGESGDDESFSDITISAGQGWGRGHGKMVEVQPNGQTMLLPPQYIYGPEKPDLQTPTLLSIDMPRAGQAIVRVNEVSDYGILRVYVDGKPAADYSFSALPNSAPPKATTRQTKEGMYQATFEKDCAINLPAGQHSMELADIAGDWLRIKSIRFTNARSSKIADLFIYALRDQSTGQIIAWLHNPQSNWRNDADGKTPATISEAVLSVPAENRKYHVEWWNTYKGEVFQKGDVVGEGGHLHIPVPAVQRDIAVDISHD